MYNIVLISSTFRERLYIFIKLIYITSVFFNIYPLLTEFEVRTVSYGLSFFPLIYMAQARSARATNRKAKSEDP